jgi:hypothetical protein
VQMSVCESVCACECVGLRVGVCVCDVGEWVGLCVRVWIQMCVSVCFSVCV